MLPAQLGPPLHVKHASLPNSITKTKPGSSHPRTPLPNAQKGCVFNRQRGVSFPPAPTPAMEGRRDDAFLIASELVTNAVLHSLCRADDFLEVCITWDGWLRISVLDPGASGGAAEIAERPVGL